MKSTRSSVRSLRTVLLLAGAAVLFSGCQFWNPATWNLGGRRSVEGRRLAFESSSPYLASADRQRRADRRQLVEVSGMGYGSTVRFGETGEASIVSESEPVSAAGETVAPSSSWLAEMDHRARRERFGHSLAEKPWQDEAGRDGAEDAGQAPAPDPYAHLPNGIPVQGKPGFVNLPEPHSGLPPIDVRGIASGTPVEIPNPLVPGDKIQFRVP